MVNVDRYVEVTIGFGVTYKRCSLLYPSLLCDASLVSDVDTKTTMLAMSVDIQCVGHPMFNQLCLCIGIHHYSYGYAGTFLIKGFIPDSVT